MNHWSSPEHGAGSAPGQLEVVRNFLNSDDRFNKIDWLATEELAVKAGYSGHEHELPALREARAILREVVADGGPESRERATELAARHPLVVVFDDGDTHLKSNRSLIGFLLGAAHEAQLRGDWFRLGFCDNPDCQWSYFDTSRNHSQRWCSMNECGGVMKARAYRQRRKASVPPAS